MSGDRRVGLMVAGAAARGAYEAGALSVLLPVLEEKKKLPRILVGTSAGAINAVLLAQNSHLGAETAANELVRVWTGLTLANVIHLGISTSMGKGLRYLGEFLGIPGCRLESLFDTAPLRKLAKRELKLEQVRENIENGAIRSLAVASTSSIGRTTVFVQSKAKLPKTDKDRAIDYVAAEIGPEHVLASSAIPVLFPPIEVANPTAGTGWYRDGLVRLNAPIKPALALEAKELVLVASQPQTYPELRVLGACDRPPCPDLGDAISLLLNSVLGDRMVEDIRRLCLENIKARKRSEAGGDADAESGGSKEVIPHLFVGPEDRSNIPLAAERLFAANHGTMCKFFSPLSILGRILGSQSRSRGELLSWLFFEPCFMQVLITMGAVDARNRLKRAKDLHAFPFGREPGEVERSFSQ